MTNAQKTIYDLKEVWINKCNQFRDKSNEVLELGKKKNGNYDPELDQKVAEQKALSQEAMKALGAYHNACIEYINGLLIHYYNDPHIAEMTKQFWEKTKTTEDWYPLMEKEAAGKTMVNHVGPSKNLPVVFQMQLLGTVLNFKSLSKMSKPALIVVVGLSGIALAIETIHAIKNC